MNAGGTDEAKQGAASASATNWAWRTGTVVVLLLGFWLRAAYYHEPYGHPDEPITVEVVGHMRQSGDWDTNWAKAPKLEDGLRYDQYNFSSHLYATFWFYRLVKVLPGTADWRGADGGFWVYRFFSVVLAAMVVWLAIRLGERAGGRVVALGAGLLVAVAPLLVQDAHYSRPEAFVTWLTLAAVGLCWPRKELGVTAVLTGAVTIGLLVACKVSMLLIAWLPLVPVVSAALTDEKRRWWRHGLLGAAALGAMAAGFALGVPGAISHPEVFLKGVKHLMEQYGGLHPPHSHMSGAMVGDMLAAYFGATLGWPMLMAGVIGVGALAWRRRWAELAVLAGPVVMFAGYFSTKGVFFERNLSHVVPLGLILAAVGVVALVDGVSARWGSPGRRGTAVSAAVILLLLAMRPGLVAGRLVFEGFSGEAADRRNQAQKSFQAQYPTAEWRETLLVNSGPLEELAAHFKAGRGTVLLRVTDYNDEWTTVCLRLLTERFELREVGRIEGIFAGHPTSTLLTYTSPLDRVYLVTGAKQQ
jgi:hypothetical protein